MSYKFSSSSFAQVNVFAIANKRCCDNALHVDCRKPGIPGAGRTGKLTVRMNF